MPALQQKVDRKEGKEATGSNNPQDNDPQNATRAKAVRSVFSSIVIAAGGILVVMVWLLSVTANGFFGFFSENPAVQLFPISLVLCLIIFVAIHRFVGTYKKNKPWYNVATLLSVAIFTTASLLVQQRRSEDRHLAAQRKQDHDIITSVPSRFDELGMRFERTTSNSDILHNISPTNLSLLFSVSVPNCLYLTNDCLMFTGDYLAFSNLNAVLVVPVPHGQRNVTVRFGIENASRSTVEYLDLAFGLYEGLNCIPGEGFEKIGSRDGHFRFLSFEKEFVPARKVDWIPEMTFAPEIGSEHFLTNKIPFSIWVSAKNVSPFIVAFQISFADEGTNAFAPQLIPFAEYKISADHSYSNLLNGNWRKP